MGISPNAPFSTLTVSYMRAMRTTLQSFAALFLGSMAVISAANVSADDALRLTDDQPLREPPVGSYQLRVLTPKLLELTLITTKPADPAPVSEWNFEDANGQPHLPALRQNPGFLSRPQCRRRQSRLQTPRLICFLGEARFANRQ